MSLTFKEVVAAVAVGLASLHADVRLPAIFSEHMVLQWKQECAIWGWASAGETVSVTIAGKTRSAEASSDGRWAIRMPALTEPGPYSLTVSGANRITIGDVLAGEVWLGSGQSNMELTVGQAQDFDREKAAANFPRLRMFKEESPTATTEQFVGKGRWVVCSPETVGRFSATLYFFGREIHRFLATPVGLINASVGGTPIESWIPAEAQYASERLKPFFAEARMAAARFDAAAAQAKYERDLAAWREAVAAAKSPQAAPPKPVNMVEVQARWSDVGGLFNGKIAPLIPFTIRGAVWYQGEANAGQDKARFYQYQLPLLVTEWRRRWGDDFPFAWVQLPNLAVSGRDWPLVREGMLKSLAVPHTGMTVNIDSGDPHEIHAKNKQEIGLRLSFWALAEVYEHHEIPWCGPLFASFEKRDRCLVVRFNHTDGGLVAKSGELQGFTIAAEDRRWRPASARIEGDVVIVTSAEVLEPVAVRYAWENNPACSLYNAAGLPASPFRTDDWPSQ